MKSVWNYKVLQVRGIGIRIFDYLRTKKSGDFYFLIYGSKHFIKGFGYIHATNEFVKHS